MKNRLLIIEDNIYRYFTTKQILESKCKLSVSVIGVESEKSLMEETFNYNPHSIMLNPNGGVSELLKTIQRRHINRINTEVLFIVTNEKCGSSCSKWISEFKIKQQDKIIKAAA